MPDDWEIKFIDMNVQKLNNEEIYWSDYVFISSMLVQKESVNKIIKKVKKFNKKIFAGGPLLQQVLLINQKLTL